MPVQNAACSLPEPSIPAHAPPLHHDLPKPLSAVFGTKLPPRGQVPRQEVGTEAGGPGASADMILTWAARGRAWGALRTPDSRATPQPIEESFWGWSPDMGPFCQSPRGYLRTVKESFRGDHT